MAKGSNFQELDDNNPIASAPINVREEGIRVAHPTVVIAPTKNDRNGKKGKLKTLDIQEHLQTIEEVCTKYETEVDRARPAASIGLRAGVATERLALYGPNVLKPPRKKHWTLVFGECLLNLFNILLMLAAAGTYVLFIMNPVDNFQNSYIGAILFGVTIINAFIEFYQIQKSAAVMDSFMKMVPARANAVRHGLLRQVPAAELVPGDVVYVKMGDKVPADLFLFHVSDLKVDNSALTGESEPQERMTTNNQKNALEATNLAFSGTMAVAGEGYGIVIRTGDNTVLGQIAGLTIAEKKRESPLTHEIERFCKIISFFAFTTAVTFFVICLFRTTNFNYSLSFAIGILVAWVPQGLPATVTMLLTIAAKRMAGMNVLVKDLQGVETLGAITMLCSDKTGTLTRNQMTVTCVWTNGKMFIANGKPQEEDGEVPLQLNAPGVMDIVYISALCSRARFNRLDVPPEKREIIGDATESGLLRFVAGKVENIDTLQTQYDKKFEIPFNSDTKTHMAVIDKSHPDGPYTLYLKGAPERVLRQCSKILHGGEVVDLTEEHKKNFTEAYEAMAGKGHRVLAFAQLLLPESSYPADTVFTKETINKMNYSEVGILAPSLYVNYTQLMCLQLGMCFVGLTSLEDPPKHGVREAVGQLRIAGIKVVMVTGDHPLTAEAIARKINLIVGDTKERIAKRTGRNIMEIAEHEASAIVIHGEEIPKLTEADWDNIFSKDEIVFARTSPKNKLDIVKRAQALGHIVGVTGDGVNDSPALKTSDLGIAMNNSGSDVSKDAASMILLDDNFATIVKGITEGRLIFMNLKKSIQYAVSHIIPEVIPYLLYVVVPIPLALTSIQILVIDLGFELLAALSYAWDPPETKEGLMQLQPRKPVTNETIARARRKLLERREAGLLPPPPPPESQREGEPEEEWEVPSRWRRYAHELRMMTYWRYWVDLFCNQEGEVLVDAEVLTWSYLEAGVWMCIGSLVTFFTVLYWSFGIDPATAISAQAAGGYFMPHSRNLTLPIGWSLTGDQQWEALKQGQSAVYLSILVIQMWNLFACKARLRYPFGRFMIQNEKTWWSVLAGIAFGVLIVYTPFMNALFGTSMYLNPAFLAIPFAFGFLLLVYRAIRRAFLNRFSPLRKNRPVENLQMYPTRWSLPNIDVTPRNTTPVLGEGSIEDSVKEKEGESLVSSSLSPTMDDFGGHGDPDSASSTDTSDSDDFDSIRDTDNGKVPAGGSAAYGVSESSKSFPSRGGTRGTVGSRKYGTGSKRTLPGTTSSSSTVVNRMSVASNRNHHLNAAAPTAPPPSPVPSHGPTELSPQIVEETAAAEAENGTGSVDLSRPTLGVLREEPNLSVNAVLRNRGKSLIHGEKPKLNRTFDDDKGGYGKRNSVAAEFNILLTHSTSVDSRLGRNLLNQGSVKNLVESQTDLPDSEKALKSDINNAYMADILSQSRTDILRNLLSASPSVLGTSSLSIPTQQMMKQGAVPSIHDGWSGPCHEKGCVVSRIRGRRQVQLYSAGDVLVFDKIAAWKMKNPGKTMKDAWDAFVLESLGRTKKLDALLKLHYGIRRYDYILKFPTGSIKEELQRRHFEKKLLRKGLILEREQSIEEPTETFVKILTPFLYLCNEAQSIKLKLPVEEIAEKDMEEECDSPKKSPEKKKTSPFLQTLLNLCQPLYADKMDISRQAAVFQRRRLNTFKGGDASKSSALDVQLKFFRDSHRSMLTYSMITKIEIKVKNSSGKTVRKDSIGQLLEQNIYTAMFHLHDDEVTPPGEEPSLRSRLRKEWVQTYFTFQPLDDISAYFGEKVALYFAFIGFYNRWLILAALAGIVVTVYGLVEGTFLEDGFVWTKIFDNTLSPFFGLFISAWVVVLPKVWKRQTNILSWRWSTTDFEQIEVKRPQFKATTTRRNPVTGKQELHFPARTRALRQMISWIVIGFCILLASGFKSIEIIGGILVAGRFKSHFMTSFVVCMFGLLEVMIMKNPFRYFAELLNEWENYRTESNYDDAIILKSYALDFVNSYSLLFYFALVKPNVHYSGIALLPHLSDGCFVVERGPNLDEPQCTGVLIISIIILFVVGQLLERIEELVIPWLISKSAELYATIKMRMRLRAVLKRRRKELAEAKAYDAAGGTERMEAQASQSHMELEKPDMLQLRPSLAQGGIPKITAGEGESHVTVVHPSESLLAMAEVMLAEEGISLVQQQPPSSPPPAIPTIAVPPSDPPGTSPVAFQIVISGSQDSGMGRAGSADIQKTASTSSLGSTSPSPRRIPRLFGGSAREIDKSSRPNAKIRSANDLPQVEDMDSDPDANNPAHVFGVEKKGSLDSPAFDDPMPPRPQRRAGGNSGSSEMRRAMSMKERSGSNLGVFKLGEVRRSVSFIQPNAPEAAEVASSGQPAAAEKTDLDQGVVATAGAAYTGLLSRPVNLGALSGADIFSLSNMSPDDYVVEHAAQMAKQPTGATLIPNGAANIIASVPSGPSQHGGANIAALSSKLRKKIRLPQFYRDDKLVPSQGIRDEFSQKVLQLGFLALFSCAFPLAPLFALMNNVYEVRTDAFKLLTVYQRPLPARAQDIGIWSKILSFVAHVAVLTNSVILAFNSPAFDGLLAPFSSDTGSKYAARLTFIIAFHYCVHVLVTAFLICVPEMPRPVQLAMERAAYLDKVRRGQEVEEEDEKLSASSLELLRSE
ncbi:hypothetical protein HDU96_002789 [Phlyctochytrium bullatum]|nr:hypothetical protein HDU96_002789 [Phlyctochytrium bullatum]